MFFSDLRSEISNLKSETSAYLLQNDKSYQASPSDNNDRDDIPRNKFSLAGRAASPGPAGPSATGWTLHTVVPEFVSLKN